MPHLPSKYRFNMLRRLSSRAIRKESCAKSRQKFISDWSLITSLHDVSKSSKMKTLSKAVNSSTKGRCHGNFSLFWSKLLKYLTRYPFSNMILLSELQKENIKWFSLRRTNRDQFFFFFGDFSKTYKLQTILILASRSHKKLTLVFFVLVGLLLTKLNHYFHIFIDTNDFWT